MTTRRMPNPDDRPAIIGVSSIKCRTESSQCDGCRLLKSKERNGSFLNLIRGKRGFLKFDM